MEIIPEDQIYFLCFLAWLCGGMVSVVTGFGCGLPAIPIMMLCISADSAFPISSVMSCFTIALILFKFWRYISWQRLLRLLIPGLLGCLAGVFFLSIMPMSILNLVIGIFFLACVAWDITRNRLKKVVGRQAGSLTIGLLGFLGGAVNGIAGVGGSFIAVLATLENWDKDMARAVIGLFMTTTLLFVSIIDWQTNILSYVEWKIILYSIPGAILGTLVGIPIATSISQTNFRRCLLFCVTFAGISMIYKAVTHLL